MKCFGDEARIIEYINWHYRSAIASCALCDTAIARVMVRIASDPLVVVSSFLLPSKTCDFLRNLPRYRSRTHNQVTLSTSHFQIFLSTSLLDSLIQHFRVFDNWPPPSFTSTSQSSSRKV